MPLELFLPISKAKNHKPISEALQGFDEISHGKRMLKPANSPTPPLFLSSKTGSLRRRTLQLRLASNLWSSFLILLRLWVCVTVPIFTGSIFKGHLYRNYFYFPCFIPCYCQASTGSPQLTLTLTALQFIFWMLGMKETSVCKGLKSFKYGNNKNSTTKRLHDIYRTSLWKHSRGWAF